MTRRVTHDGTDHRIASVTRRDLLSLVGLGAVAAPLVLNEPAAPHVPQVTDRSLGGLDFLTYLEKTAKQLLDAVEARLIVGRLVTRNYEHHVGESGDYVNFPVLRRDGGLDNIPAILQCCEATCYVPFGDLVKDAEELQAILQPPVIELADQIETLLWKKRTAYDSHVRIQAPWEQPKLVFDCLEQVLVYGHVPPGQPISLVVDSVTFNDNCPPGHPLAAPHGDLHSVKPYKVRGVDVYPSWLPMRGIHRQDWEREHLAFAKESLILVSRPLELPPKQPLLKSEHPLVFSVRAIRNDLALRLIAIPHVNEWTFVADMLCGATVVQPSMGLQLVV